MGMRMVFGLNYAKLVLYFLSVIGLSIALNGCSYTASPYLYNGHYYMAGDDNCRQWVDVGQSKISCMNSDGDFRGYRDPMSGDEIQMYQHESAMQAEQMQQLTQQLTQQLNQTGQQFQQSGQQFQQYQPYTPPTVTPVSVPTRNQVRCVSASVVTNCSYY